MATARTIETLLRGHELKHLFIHELGWDHGGTRIAVEEGGDSFDLLPIAHKRGFTAFECPVYRTTLADRRLLQRIQRRVAKSCHEHLIVYTADVPPKQVWQWLVRAPDGRVVRHREHPFLSASPPPKLVARLGAMQFSLDEEEKGVLLSDAINRVRAALDVLPENELFTKWPGYAKRSDALAMAMKRGEPGAFDAFVALHMPLARKMSRRLHYWVDLDPEDAEQIASIGLIESARRFEPERGFQFSTYASWWIRQVCQRYGVEAGSFIRLPVHVFWPCYKARADIRRLLDSALEGAAESTVDKTLSEHQLDPKRYRAFERARSITRFCDMDPAELSKVFNRGSRRDNVVEHARIGEAADIVAWHLQTLGPRREDILRRRYGIGRAEQTLEEVGSELGVTRERVRQIQAKAEQALARRAELARLIGLDSAPEAKRPAELSNSAATAVSTRKRRRVRKSAESKSPEKGRRRHQKNLGN